MAHENLAGSKNGYDDPIRQAVVIDSGLAPEQAAKTLIHETAHVVMGHTDDLTDCTEHRDLMETEAYVVAGLVGFDTAAYSVGYITGRANGDTDLVQSTAGRVLTAAHNIAPTWHPPKQPTSRPHRGDMGSSAEWTGPLA